MTRTAFRRALVLAASALVVCALVLAAAAPAAKPKKGARFSGHTNAPPVEGFKAPVRFTVAASGSSLGNFTFGSFGCFGAGGFRPHVNPYTGDSLIDAGRLKLGSNGKFSDSATATHTVAGQTTTTKMTISGKFSTPKRVSGTIELTQAVKGAGVDSSCGPAKLSYSASAK